MQQDVYYYNDERHRGCVNLYARALEIVNGNNPDRWEYTIVQAAPDSNQMVHHANLLSDTFLDVSGGHSPQLNLSLGTHYNVYFDVRVMHDATGLTDPVTCEFTDQNGSIRRSAVQLMPGDARILVGDFISSVSSSRVMAKLYESNRQQKSGLLIRCITIVPANTTIKKPQQSRSNTLQIATTVPDMGCCLNWSLPMKPWIFG